MSSRGNIQLHNKDTINGRILKINGLYGQTGYEEKSIKIKNPSDWRVVFKEQKKQLRKPKVKRVNYEK